MTSLTDADRATIRRMIADVDFVTIPQDVAEDFYLAGKRAGEPPAIAKDEAGWSMKLPAYGVCDACHHATDCIDAGVCSKRLLDHPTRPPTGRNRYD